MNVNQLTILRAIRQHLQKHDINVPAPNNYQAAIHGSTEDRKVLIQINTGGEDLMVTGSKRLHDLCNENSWSDLGTRFLPLADPDLLDNLINTIKHIIDGRQLT